MKVLVCPLDWGLGHATRCIPVIRALKNNGHQVVVGATGGGLRLLQAEFPTLDIFPYPGYQVRYSRSPATFLPVMLLQLPALLLGMVQERAFLRRILSERRPDLVISDGRYGVFTPAVPCIFITHQIFIRIPGRFPGVTWVTKLVLALNVRLLRRFQEVWVPDFPGSKNLSGALSHGKCRLANLVFIQPLSRFQVGKGKSSESNTHASPFASNLAVPIDVLALVSGPEPQRTLFEKSLRQELQKMSGTRILVCGLPSASRLSENTRFDLKPGQLNEFLHLPGDTLSFFLAHAKMVVARSGYTTVMEMARLEVKSIVLVPTPGQSEQEYLADHLDHSRTALRMDQDRLELLGVAAKLRNYTGFVAEPTAIALASKAEMEASNFSLEDFIHHHPMLQIRAPE